MMTSLRRSSSESTISQSQSRRAPFHPRAVLRHLRNKPFSPPSNSQQSQSSHQSLPANDQDDSNNVKLPYARKNLQLKFWQVASDGTFSEGYLSRQEILSDIRQNWAGEERSPSYRASIRARQQLRQADNAKVKRERRARGRGRGRPITHAQASPGVPTAKRTGTNRLTVRDMRQIDPSFTFTPAIWVREDAMVVSLESVRAIILHNRMLIFEPDNEKVQNAIWYVKKRLANDIEDAFLPFEFRALEGILVFACTVLERDFIGIEPELRTTLGGLPSQITNERLERLRLLEQRLNQFYSKARKVQQALQAVLDEDEDMADMYLTEKRKNPSLVRNPIDHDEAEVLLETYLQTVDDLTSKAELLNQAIDDTENLIEIHLDTIQNRMLLVDLRITICNSGISFATMVTSLFGMNFPLPSVMSTLPSSKYFFLGSVLTTLFMILLGLGILTKWCRRQGIYGGRAKKMRTRSKGNVMRQKKERVQNTSPPLPKATELGNGVRFGWIQSDVDGKV